MPGKGGYELEIPIDTTAVDRAFEKMQQKIDALNRVDTNNLTKSSEDAMKRIERVAEAVEKKVADVNTGSDAGIGFVGSKDDKMLREFESSQAKLGRGLGSIQERANKVQERAQSVMHSGFGDVVGKLFPPLAIVAGGVGTILAALETGPLGSIFEILSKTAEMYLMPISMIMGMFLKPFALHGMRMAMSWMKYAQPWFKRANDLVDAFYEIGSFAPTGPQNWEEYGDALWEGFWQEPKILTHLRDALDNFQLIPDAYADGLPLDVPDDGISLNLLNGTVEINGANIPFDDLGVTVWDILTGAWKTKAQAAADAMTVEDIELKMGDEKHKEFLESIAFADTTIDLSSLQQKMMDALQFEITAMQVPGVQTDDTQGGQSTVADLPADLDTSETEEAIKEAIEHTEELTEDELKTLEDIKDAVEEGVGMVGGYGTGEAGLGTNIPSVGGMPISPAGFNGASGIEYYPSTVDAFLANAPVPLPRTPVTTGLDADGNPIGTGGHFVLGATPTVLGEDGVLRYDYGDGVGGVGGMMPALDTDAKSAIYDAEGNAAHTATSIAENLLQHWDDTHIEELGDLPSLFRNNAIPALENLGYDLSNTSEGFVDMVIQIANGMNDAFQTANENLSAVEQVNARIAQIEADAIADYEARYGETDRHSEAQTNALLAADGVESLSAYRAARAQSREASHRVQSGMYDILAPGLREFLDTAEEAKQVIEETGSIRDMEIFDAALWEALQTQSILTGRAFGSLMKDMEEMSFGTLLGPEYEEQLKDDYRDVLAARFDGLNEHNQEFYDRVAANIDELLALIASAGGTNAGHWTTGYYGIGGLLKNMGLYRNDLYALQESEANAVGMAGVTDGIFESNLALADIQNEMASGNANTVLSIQSLGALIDIGLGNVISAMINVESAVKSNPANVTIAVTKVLGDFEGGIIP